MISVRSFLVAALVAGAVAACTPPPPAASHDEPARLLTTETRTVLTGEDALLLTRQCSRVSPGPAEGQWSPTTEQLDALDRALDVVLAHQLGAAGSDASPSDYYRQAAGFIIGGRRVIYVNGVHRSVIESTPAVTARDPTRTWRDYPILICDGGPITFGVEYDPETRTFRNFAFNGAI